MSPPLVLIAEDESLIAMLYAEVLGAEGYRIRLALETWDAKRSIRAELPSAAIVDLRLRDGEGDARRSLRCDAGVSMRELIAVAGSSLQEAAGGGMSRSAPIG